MLRVLSLLLLVPLLAACASVRAEAPPPSPTVEERGPAIASLRGAVADIAAAQASAESTLAGSLERVRELDDALTRFRSVDTLDIAVSEWEELREHVLGSGPTGLRQEWIDLARLIDEARVHLADARAMLKDEWEMDYLDAQDAVLVAARDHAEASDRVAQLMQQHWPTYRSLVEQLDSFVERRWYLRTTQESADALAVELDAILDEVATAQTQLRQYLHEQEQAAARVNAANADSVAVWERRPPDRPTDAG